MSTSLTGAWTGQLHCVLHLQETAKTAMLSVRPGHAMASCGRADTPWLLAFISARTRGKLWILQMELGTIVATVLVVQWSVLPRQPG